MRTQENKEKIETAIRLFLRNDHQDLTRINVHEMSLAHRIAVYMEKDFSGHSIDCEYNKQYDGGPKMLNGKKIRPDIIVHRRGGGDAVVIMELKKAGHSSKSARKEIQKLKDEQNTLGYPLAVYIGVLKSGVEVVWIKNGEEDKCQKLIDHNDKWVECKIFRRRVDGA